jgi:hypothetical protein
MCYADGSVDMWWGCESYHSLTPVLINEVGGDSKGPAGNLRKEDMK